MEQSRNLHADTVFPISTWMLHRHCAFGEPIEGSINGMQVYQHLHNADADQHNADADQHV
jgi:hypothetical protein